MYCACWPERCPLNPTECRFDSKRRRSLTLTASTPPRRSNAHPQEQPHVNPSLLFTFLNLSVSSSLTGCSLDFRVRVWLIFICSTWHLKPRSPIGQSWVWVCSSLVLERSFSVCPLDHSAVSFTRLLRCHFLGETYSDPCLGPFGLLSQSSTPLPGFIIFFSWLHLLLLNTTVLFVCLLPIDFFFPSGYNLYEEGNSRILAPLYSLCWCIVGVKQVFD